MRKARKIWRKNKKGKTNIYNGERMREGFNPPPQKKNKWVCYCRISQSTILKVYNLIGSKVSEFTNNASIHPLK